MQSRPGQPGDLRFDPLGTTWANLTCGKPVQSTYLTVHVGRVHVDHDAILVTL